MVILGIHDGHNATATVIKDGKVIACASEERFSRIKNDLGYPLRAVEHLLYVLGIRPQQLDAVALATKDQENPVSFKIKYDSLFRVEDYKRMMYEYWRPLLYENRETDFWQRIWNEPRFKENNVLYDIEFVKNTPKEKWKEAFINERIRFISNHLRIPPDKIHLIDHHAAHAHYAYYASRHAGDQKAAIVTADSWGDGCNATISVVKTVN